MLAIACSVVLPDRASAADDGSGAPAARPSAPTKDQCADAYEQAQRQRKAYELRAAHEQLLICGTETCPTFMREDCTKWLAEVETSTPTIVLLARDASGSALVDVRVSMDGKPLSDHLDGRAISVDPGAHQMHFEWGGQVSDAQVVVAEGARNQQIVVDFAGSSARAATSASPGGAALHTVPTASWVLGGVAVAGALSFAAFALAGRGVQSCSPGCSRSQVDELRRDYLVADVSWIAGLVAAGAALVLYLVEPAAPGHPPTTALRW